jgi:hypothetical protein
MILFIIGLLAGIVGGMGIGGGTILIPALVIFIKPEQHVAQGVNLLFFVPTAIAALIIHIRNKRIDFKSAIPIMVFGLLGAYVGSRLAISLSGIALRKSFGVFLLIIGVYELLRNWNFKKRKVTSN